MQASVKIVDWEPGTERQARPALRLVSETLTAGELIAATRKAEYRAMEATDRTCGEKHGFCRMAGRAGSPRTEAQRE